MVVADIAALAVAGAAGVAAAPGLKMALGVHEQLDDFANQIGALSWKVWGRGASFRIDFQQLASSETTTIHFNLTDRTGQMINANKAVQDFITMTNPTITNWELYMLRSNPEWLRRTIFYFQGRVVPNPFQ